jgi:hypothetical protein
MRTFFARAYKAWVVYEGERLPMYWWESSSTGHSHPWVNMPATELLARPSTEIVRGGIQPGECVIHNAYIAMKSGMLRSCIIIPDNTPPADDIQQEAEQAIGSDRVQVMADLKRRYIVSLSAAKTPDEETERDNDLIWAFLRYC